MRTTVRRRVRSRSIRKTRRNPRAGARKYKKSELFPYKKGVNYSDLMLTPEAEYSITRREDGEVLLRHMKSVLGSLKDKTITDATGNVGGDTILFGLHFKHVDSVEIDDDNIAALRHNVDAYGLTNVTLHKGDSTQIIDWVSDVLYVDAPWGGPDYKQKKDLDLYLGDVRVDEFVGQAQNPHIFLKLPRNYNFDRIAYSRKFPIRNYFLLYIKTNLPE
jgi:tRNA/tmRNA/rRNA uracil-C5-methylase (TrmA/RlmC/RlmD family)